jgi:hypothetical protein
MLERLGEMPLLLQRTVLIHRAIAPVGLTVRLVPNQVETAELQEQRQGAWQSQVKQLCKRGWSVEQAAQPAIVAGYMEVDGEVNEFGAYLSPNLINTTDVGYFRSPTS